MGAGTWASPQTLVPREGATLRVGARQHPSTVSKKVENKRASREPLRDPFTTGCAADKVYHARHLDQALGAGVQPVVERQVLTCDEDDFAEPRVPRMAGIGRVMAEV